MYDSTILAKPSLVVGNALDGVTLAYIASTASIGIVSFFVSCNSKRYRRLLNSAGFVFASGAVASLSTVFLLVGGDSPALFCFFACLTGVGTSTICMKVGCLYGSVPLRQSVANIAASMVVAMLLFFSCLSLPWPMGGMFFALMPLFAVLLGWLVHDDGENEDMDFPEGGLDVALPPAASRLYARLLAAIALLAFAGGTGMGAIANIGSVDIVLVYGKWVVLGSGALALLLAVLACRGRGMNGLTTAYSVFVSFGAVVSVLGFLTDDRTLVGVMIAKEGVWLLLTAVLAYASLRLERSAIRYFGLGQSVYFVVSTIGWAFGRVALPMTGVPRAALVVMMFALFLVVVVFVLPSSELRLLMRSPQELAGDDGASSESAENVSAALDRAGETPCTGVSASEPAAFALLTDREREVVALYAQGRSATWIADELVLSANTIRAHLRTAYTKLDVHNRQELIDRLKEDSLEA